MLAKGQFDIRLLPQTKDDVPAGRMLIKKTYSGDLQGSGAGQMISKRVENGPAIYYAIEEFSGAVDGKTGTFTLVHRGFMSRDSQSLKVEILEGSGVGNLQDISGSMDISQDGEIHSYELTYELRSA